MQVEIGGACMRGLDTVCACACLLVLTHSAHRIGIETNSSTNMIYIYIYILYAASLLGVRVRGVGRSVCLSVFRSFGLSVGRWVGRSIKVGGSVCRSVGRSAVGRSY